MSPRLRPRRTLFPAALSILVLSLILYAAVALFSPFGPATETFVDLPSHTSTAQIAAQLQQSGVIRSRLAFRALALVHHRTLHPGEYRFDHPVPLAQVYAHIARGDIYTRTLVIPEGYNLFDIAAAVERAGLGPSVAFLAAARRHTELIAGLSPQASSLEGFLFPATYKFSRQATPEQMLYAMVRRFRQAAAQLNLNDNIVSTVILASLVEKEVGVATERPLVAGVFRNRLARGMPLETDPAVIYAALLEGRYRGTIYRSDLQSPSAYNTYRHPGLPPGPICNPGLASLRAALAPAQTPFLYFVADAQGHTRFSITRKEHEDQVAAYREIERARVNSRP